MKICMFDSIWFFSTFSDVFENILKIYKTYGERACQFLWHCPKRKTIPNLTIWAYIKLNTNANNGGFGHLLEYQYTLVWVGHWNPGSNSANYFGWGIIRRVSGNQTEKNIFSPPFSTNICSQDLLAFQLNNSGIYLGYFWSLPFILKKFSYFSVKLFLHFYPLVI